MRLDDDDNPFLHAERIARGLVQQRTAFAAIVIAVGAATIEVRTIGNRKSLGDIRASTEVIASAVTGDYVVVEFVAELGLTAAYIVAQ
jgi:energy-converting hydrogenase Eha subunit A